MADCIFCKIVEGKITAAKVSESENVIAFLDINPISSGHTLVVSKEHFELLVDVPDKLLGDIIAVTRRVAKGVMKATGSDGFNLLQNNHRCAGQSIPHVHFHIIPRKIGDHSWFNWKPKSSNGQEIETLRDAIKGNIL